MNETWFWATVTGINPTRITTDEPGASSTSPSFWLTDQKGLAVNDRVMCQLLDNRITVIGKSAPSSAWATLTPSSPNWTSYSTYGGGVPYSAPQYRRIDGMVQISGGWIGYAGTAGTFGAGSVFAICQPLPVGHRPTRVLRMPVASEMNGTWIPSELVIYDGGNINWIPRASATLNPGANTWIAIPLVHFPAA